MAALPSPISSSLVVDCINGYNPHPPSVHAVGQVTLQSPPPVFRAWPCDLLLANEMLASMMQAEPGNVLVYFTRGALPLLCKPGEPGPRVSGE